MDSAPQRPAAPASIGAAARAAGALFVLASCPTPPPDDDDSSPAGDDDDSSPSDRPVTLAGSCPMESRFGRFAVQAQANYSVVDGYASDGVVPVSILEPIEESGDCRLLRRNNPFCDPLCEAGWTCDFDGDCVPYPSNQDLGTVTITGLRDAVAMSPVPPSMNYFDTTLPHPAFEPGAEIRIDAAPAGSWPAIEMEGLGLEPLSVPAEGWTVAEGADLAVSWTAADSPDERARVALTLNVDQHGITPISLVCDLADSGSASIAASLVDALLGAGISGWPNASLSRQTVDSQDFGDGCLEFVVSTPRPVSVAVSGHIPCNGPGDCPPPLECNLPINTCE